MYDTTIDLIPETIIQDAALNEVKLYGEGRPIYVRAIRSISRNEFYQAAAQGLHPAAVLVIFAGDYEGEKVIRWDSQFYKISRTYQKPGSDDLELTVEETLELIEWPGGESS